MGRPVRRRSAFLLRARRGTSAQSFATTFTELRVRRCKMRSATRRQAKSKRTSHTATVFFGCVSGTMEKGLTRSTCKRDGMDTGVCQACASAPNKSARNSRCGAKSERVRRWSCAFQAPLFTRRRAAVAVFSATSMGYSAKRRKDLMSADRVPIRVLSVDDHPLLREAVAALLSTESDMTLVAEASNGHEAIEQFRTHRPDVTLMDLQMPKMNGLDAMIAIRGEFPGARIIVLTTYAGDVQVLRAVKAGARAYLLKSLVRKDLVEIIRLVHTGGKRIPPEVAAELAEHAADEALSSREIEVLGLISGGNANKEIAAKLFITEETVKGHMKSIFAKLGVHDRAHAVTIGVKRGILDLSHPARGVYE